MQRGDVYRFRLPKGVGHEQAGERFGVVVQTDAMLPRSVVLVAPTSREPDTTTVVADEGGTTTSALETTTTTATAADSQVADSQGAGEFARKYTTAVTDYVESGLVGDGVRAASMREIVTLFDPALNADADDIHNVCIGGREFYFH